MRKRIVGNGLEVSLVGFGCMGLTHAYGQPINHSDAINIIKEAVKVGYTFFDTAEIYGTRDDPFENERIVGEALSDVRDKVVIATKFGIQFDMNSDQVPYPIITDSSPTKIRASFAGSLKRLRTDYIDSYYQHRIDPNTSPETVASVMKELINEGKIKY